MVFTTNPYVNYHDENSKQFIQLNKGAMIDFRSTEQFDLKPSNADAFSEYIDKISKSYAYYGMIRRSPTTFLPDAAGTYILVDHANFLENWNQIRFDVVLNNANMTCRDKTFTDIITGDKKRRDKLLAAAAGDDGDGGPKKKKKKK